MAVPEQTPFIEYTANGTTTVYPLTFDCDKSEYLIVSLDGEEAPVGSWSLLNDTVTFNSAPANGVKVVLQRNTPFQRTTNYQSYDNSFRPTAVNKDFDLIWWKLQELGYRDQVIWLVLLKEIEDRKLGDAELLNYINTQIEALEQDYINRDIELKNDYISRDAALKNYIDQMIALVTGDPSFEGITTEFVIEGDENQKQINDKTSQYVDCIDDLYTLKIRKDGMVAFVKSYHRGLNRGGGRFYYDPSRKLEYKNGVCFYGWVRIKDFDTWSVDMFGAKPNDANFDNWQAFKDCDEHVRSWHIGAGEYKIKQDFQITAKTKITSEGDLSVLNFEDCQFKLNDCNFLEFDNFTIKRTGTVVGYAVEARGINIGFRRIYFNGTKIMGSTGGGIVTSGAWIMTWINPFIHETNGYGLLAEKGAYETGINNLTLIGGEIYHASIGLALDCFKQLQIVGTAIEGNFDLGIGVGSQAGEMSILGYFEANQAGHIGGFSHKGGSKGNIQNISILAGSYFLRGLYNQNMAIRLENLRQITIQDGVGFRGYAANTQPMITLTDPEDSAKAQGSIGVIRTDCPLNLVLAGNCRYIGRFTTRSLYTQKILPDTGNSELNIFIQNPSDENLIKSKAANIDLNFKVTTAGGIALTFLFYDSAGNQVFPFISRTASASSGMYTYRLEITTLWTSAVRYIVVRRRGDDAADTATGVELVSVDVQEYVNRINKV
ncbi:hypothetical protein ACLD0L_00050 [Acinetobacter baumannii]